MTLRRQTLWQPLYGTNLKYNLCRAQKLSAILGGVFYSYACHFCGCRLRERSWTVCKSFDCHPWTESRTGRAKGEVGWSFTSTNISPEEPLAFVWSLHLSCYHWRMLIFDKGCRLRSIQVKTSSSEREGCHWLAENLHLELWPVIHS